MDTTRRALIMQRWNVIQHELLPELRNDVGTLTPKLEKVIHPLEWMRIEEFVSSTRCGEGRPPQERSWLTNAFVAKSVLGLTTTRGLIERLTIDRALRRICGFSPCRKLPSESTFARAFDEFAEARLAERVHEALVKDPLGDELIGHLANRATKIAPPATKKRSQRAIEQPVALSLPAGEGITGQGRAIEQAVAAGTLAPGQAAQLLTGLGSLARIVEIDDLAKRITLLEVAKHGNN